MVATPDFMDANMVKAEQSSPRGDDCALAYGAGAYHGGGALGGGQDGVVSSQSREYLAAGSNGHGNQLSAAAYATQLSKYQQDWGVVPETGGNRDPSPSSNYGGGGGSHSSASAGYSAPPPAHGYSSYSSAAWADAAQQQYAGYQGYPTTNGFNSNSYPYNMKLGSSTGGSGTASTPSPMYPAGAVKNEQIKNDGQVPGLINPSLQDMDAERCVRRARRNRTCFSRQQLEKLDDLFREQRYPDVYRREEIAASLDLKEEVVRVWFKNRRAKAKREAKEGRIQLAGTLLPPQQRNSSSDSASTSPTPPMPMPLYTMPYTTPSQAAPSSSAVIPSYMKPTAAPYMKPDSGMKAGFYNPSAAYMGAMLSQAGTGSVHHPINESVPHTMGGIPQHHSTTNGMMDSNGDIMKMAMQHENIAGNELNSQVVAENGYSHNSPLSEDQYSDDHSSMHNGQSA